MLVTVVQRALNQNLDLDAALARVRQARAAASGAGAELLPTADLGASATFEHQSLRGEFGSVAAGSPGFKRDGHADVVGPSSWEIDLSGGLRLEDVDIDEVIVQSIGAETITYRAKGAVSVVLQWGSNSDVSRGDGIELGQSFPFYCDIEVPLSEPWDLDGAETSYGVDTGGWRDGMEPDDCDG